MSLVNYLFMEVIKNKKYAIISLIIFLLWGVWYYNKYYGGESSIPYQKSSGMVWTTQYHITYQSEKLFDDSIKAVFDAVNNCASMFNKNSLVAKINNNECTEVDSMFVALYRCSEKVNKDTEGAFDPTVSPLMKLWGFVEKTGTMPKRSEVDSIRAFVGLNKTTLTVDNEIQKEDSRTSFDFSAIAKGYACDEVGRMLERNGVNNYLVEVGGEIVLNGQNPNGSEWNVSVDSPTERYNEMLTDNRKANEGLVILRMSSGAVATSGNYRNFKMIDGKKVVHTMNPRTGYPEDSDLLSVTIVAKNCMVADAYATACMVMGLNRSKAFLEGNDELGGFLVYAAEGDSLMVWDNERFRLMTDE